MTDREFYGKIEELSPDKDNELVTVIRGKCAGEKFLLTDGKLSAATFGLCGESAAAGHPDSDRSIIAELKEHDLLRERLGHRKNLVVCGTGFVGQSVIRLGKFLGFEVTAIDDRTDFCRAARAAGADKAIADEFRNALSSDEISYDEDTYFVVVTRGHRYDRECLLEIMKHPFGYLGMMGSKARSARMRDTLEEEGIPEDRRNLLHAPIGLKIGAGTPEEIAVSILSEIISVKAQHPGKDVFPEEILDGIKESAAGSCVLATITESRGSTPRGEKTRMLVKRDRTTIGTIGGGCMEAEVIREAMTLMTEHSIDTHNAHGSNAPGGGPSASGMPDADAREFFTVDLTGRTGNSADMLCGGAMDVLLEVL